MACPFTPSRRGLLVLYQYFEGYSNFCHLLGESVLPERVPILAIKLIGMFDACWDFNAILVCCLADSSFDLG
jgi:hypothetical protein